MFYQNSTNIKSLVKKLEDNQYLIDIDGNGNWDYTYNQVSGEINPYKDDIIELENWSIFLLIIIVISIITIILFFYKKRKM